MDKTLTTTGPTNGRITAQSGTDALIGTLPKWLQYLVGAYPAAQTNTMTYLAYETAFAEIDPALMLAAVQAVARRHKFATFPTIAEIDQAVRELSEQVDALTVAPAQLLMTLAAERQTLLEQAYAGEIDPAAWGSLTSRYKAAGMEINAAWMQRKLTQFEAAGYGA